MGDKDFFTSLGADRTGKCCNQGLACVFQAPYVGLCADPTLYITADAFPEQPAAVAAPVAVNIPVGTPSSVSEPTLATDAAKPADVDAADVSTDVSTPTPVELVDTAEWETIPAVILPLPDTPGSGTTTPTETPVVDEPATPTESTTTAVGSPDTRPRMKAEHKKCGSPTGTTAEQCMEGMYCQYLKPAFAKCTKPETTPQDFQSTPPHACGDAGAQCMGDQTFLDILGAGSIGACCKEGLRCVFKEPYMGICADSAMYI